MKSEYKVNAKPSYIYTRGFNLKTAWHDTKKHLSHFTL